MPWGCYSNDQLRSALDTVLNTLGKCYDQLDQIKTLPPPIRSPKPNISVHGDKGQ